jgi:predicted heme/steroid binding protein
MKHYTSSAEFAKDCNIPVATLNATLAEYEKCCQAKKDQFNKQYFEGSPWKANDSFNVAIITPVLHYCMGGLMCDTNGQVLGEYGPIEGLFASGEVVGGVHGAQRLGGSSLLDCVVFGRVAGRAVSTYLMNEFTDFGGARAGGGGSYSVNLKQSPSKPNTLSIDVSFNGESASTTTTSQGPRQKIYTQETPQYRSSLPTPPGWGKATTPAPVVSTPSSNPAPTPVSRPAGGGKREYTLGEVGQHKTEKDCWVVVNDEVLDVTKFLPDHPGGKKAILLYAGKDASEEFNMLHDKNVVSKYAPDSIIGTLKK